MSFDDEWASAKTAAMRVNNAGGDGGSKPKPGSADYVVEDDELGDIGVRPTSSKSEVRTQGR